MSLTDISSTINNSITNAFVSNSGVCNISNENGQQININDIVTNNCDVNFDNVKNVIDISDQETCLQGNDNILLVLGIQNDFSNSLTSSLNGNPAVTSSLMKYTHTTNIQDTVNTVTNNLHFDNMTSCVESTINSQGINISNIKINCFPGSNPPETFNMSNIENNLYGTIVQSCTQVQVNNLLEGFQGSTLTPTPPAPPAPPAPLIANQPQLVSDNQQPMIAGYLVNSPVGAGIISGIVIGSIIIIIIIWFLCLYKKQSSQQQSQKQPPLQQPQQLPQQQQHLFGLKKYKRKY